MARQYLWLNKEVSLKGDQLIRGAGLEVMEYDKTLSARENLQKALFARESGRMGLVWGPGRVSLGQNGLQRLLAIAQDAQATLAYGDYRGPRGDVPLDDLLPGSLDDKTDLGPLWVVDAAAARASLHEIPAHVSSMEALAYGLRLGLMRRGISFHLPEIQCAISQAPTDDIFSYVRQGAEIIQGELEEVFTDHLRRINVYLEPRTEPFKDEGSYPIDASVVIPVKDRAQTIADAVASALSQITNFTFNVIVVENHSSDDTGVTALKAGRHDKRFHLITPKRTDLGIGGCWNLAAFSPWAGGFLVQLDSDDVYADPESLHRLVETAKAGPWAMVVGSYTTVNMEGIPTPPGDVQHLEWTEANGHNNLLRVAGVGAPRLIATGFIRQFPMPNVSYGEDYAIALAISRRYRVARVHDILYLARRWEGNTDYRVSPALSRARGRYKNHLRTAEILARQVLNT